MEQVVATRLNSWAQGFTTKQGKMYAAERIAAALEHFNTMTMSDMSTLAGLATVKDANTVGNQAIAMVHNNPSSSTLNHGSVDAFAKAMFSGNPNVNAVEAAKAETEWADKYHHEIEMTRWQAVADQSLAGVDPKADPNYQAALHTLDTALDKDADAANYLDGTDRARLHAYFQEQAGRASEVYKAAQYQSDKTELDAGKAAFGQIDGELRDAATGAPNAKPLDQIRNDIDAFTKAYPKSAPEAEALNNAFERSLGDKQNQTYVDPAKSNWGDIQGRLMLPKSDPRAVTDTELTTDYGTAHSISLDQYRTAHEIIDRRDNVPDFAPNFEAFKTAQEELAKEIGSQLGPGSQGVSIARQQFLSDTTRLFLKFPRDKAELALKRMTDPTSPSAMVKMLDVYQRAALAGPRAADYLRKYDPLSYTPAVGSQGTPTVPTKANPGGPAPKLSQDQVDQTIWGR